MATEITLPTNQLLEKDSWNWEQKIIEDALPDGQLDLMAKKAQQEFYQGKTRPLP